MSPTKDKIVTVALIGSALWLFTKAGSLLNVVGNAESFRASGSKLMTEKAAINALTTAKGKFMTVTFLKKDGSTRRMRCRTGVKRYVKGVGSPLGTPANRLQKYKLITVYDLDKAGYRSIPIDRVISVKAAGKTFSSKNPKGKQMSAEEYNSYNAEWEAIFDVYGRRGYFADLPDSITDGLPDEEIEELIMEESDHPGWEEVDEMILMDIEKHAEGSGDKMTFELEQRDARRCPNCHGNLYAGGCVHHGIMPRMGAELIPDVLEKHTEGNGMRNAETSEACEIINPKFADDICPNKPTHIVDGWLYSCASCLSTQPKSSTIEAFDAESFDASGPGILTKEQFDVLMGRVDSMTMNELYMIRHQIHSRLKALGMDFNKYRAESFEACEYCGEAGGELVEMREEHISGPIVKVCEHCYDIARLGAESDTLTDYSDYGSLWNDTHAYLISIGKSKAKADELMERYETFVEAGYENGESPHTIGISITENERLDLEAPYVGAGALMDIGKDTGLGSFSPSELATSSAIHGDFDQASLNYSGKQNLEVRAESDRDEDEEDYEEYLRLQELCECTACGDIGPLATGTTDKQGLYRCVACVTAKHPSISEEEVVEDIDYLRGIH